MIKIKKLSVLVFIGLCCLCCFSSFAEDFHIWDYKNLILTDQNDANVVMTLYTTLDIMLPDGIWLEEIPPQYAYPELYISPESPIGLDNGCLHQIGYSYRTDYKEGFLRIVMSISYGYLTINSGLTHDIAINNGAQVILKGGIYFGTISVQNDGRLDIYCQSYTMTDATIKKLGNKIEGTGVIHVNWDNSGTSPYRINLFENRPRANVFIHAPLENDINNDGIINFKDLASCIKDKNKIQNIYQHWLESN
jgi:hypothetical protein